MNKEDFSAKFILGLRQRYLNEKKLIKRIYISPLVSLDTLAKHEAYNGDLCYGIEIRQDWLAKENDMKIIYESYDHEDLMGFNL